MATLCILATVRAGQDSCILRSYQRWRQLRPAADCVAKPHLTPPWLSFFSMLAADSRSAAAFITLRAYAGEKQHECMPACFS